MLDRVLLPLAETAAGLLRYPARWTVLGTLGAIEAVARRLR